MRTSPSQTDNNQSGGQARNDLAAQALGRLGAGRGRPLLGLQAFDGLFESGREHLRIPAVCTPRQLALARR